MSGGGGGCAIDENKLEIELLTLKLSVVCVIDVEFAKVFCVVVLPNNDAAVKF